MNTGRVVWSRPLPLGQRVLADRVGWHRLLRRSERHRLRPAGPRRPPVLDLPRQRRGQGRARAGQRDPVLRRLRRPGVRRRRRHRPAGVGGGDRRRPLRFRQRPVLRHSGGRVRTGLSRQHRRARVLIRGPDRPARVGHRNRRLRVLVGSGRQSRPDSVPLSTSAPTTAACTPSTPARARSAGPTTPAARSPAPALSSTTSCTSPTSATATRRVSTSAPGRVVFTFGDGAFNPVIADDGAIYLDGYSMLYQMLPRTRAAPRPAAPARQHAPYAARRRK